MKLNKLSLIFLIFLLFSSILFGNNENVSGTLVFRDGRVEKFTKLGKSGNFKGKTKVSGNHKGKNIEFNITKLKRLDFLPNNIIRVTNLNNDTFEIEDGKVGNQLRATGNNGFYWSFDYYYFDEITLEEKLAYTKSSKLLSIVLGEHIGSFKYNERTKQYFPADYNFDPQTGEKLVWKNLEYE